MEVGIGLPSTIPGTGRDQLLEWARRAEARGFSTLGTIDRIVYPSHDPLIALAAAAAVTERIRLVTTILLAPTRANGALLAKQAATLDVLSDGRLVLGVAVGRREDDFEAAGVDFHARAQIFDDLLERLDRHLGRRGVRRGRRDRPDAGDGRPAVILGGRVGPAFRRAAGHGDGWTGGNCTLDELAPGTARLRAAWEAAGREDAPRTLVQPDHALGDGAEQTSSAPCATTTGPGTTRTRSWRGPRPTPRRCARSPRLRRGGLRRADLLPLRPGPGPGGPARGRTPATEFATYPSLRGQVAFVSGGATGLGAEFVAQLAAQGMRWASLTCRTTPGTRSPRRCAGRPPRAALPALRRARRRGPAGSDRRHRRAARTGDRAGQQRGERRAPLRRDAERDRSGTSSMDVNLRHHFFATQAVVPMMRAAGRGSVVNLARSARTST